MWLPPWIPKTQKTKQFNLRKEMTKKRIKCRGQSIWSTNTCIQQRNGLVGGGEYNYQRGGRGGLHNMCKRRNDGVGWQRRQHNAKSTKPQRKHDKWGRRKPKIDTKDKNGFRWCEQHTQRSWLYTICSPQIKMIPVIVKRRSSITCIIVYKPKGKLWIQKPRLETSQNVYAIWHA